MIIWCIIAVVGIQIIYFIIYNIQNDMIVTRAYNKDNHENGVLLRCCCFLISNRFFFLFSLFSELESKN